MMDMGSGSAVSRLKPCHRHPFSHRQNRLSNQFVNHKVSCRCGSLPPSPASQRPHASMAQVAVETTWGLWWTARGRNPFRIRLICLGKDGTTSMANGSCMWLIFRLYSVIGISCTSTKMMPSLRPRGGRECTRIETILRSKTFVSFGWTMKKIRYPSGSHRSARLPREAMCGTTQPNS